MKINDLFEMAAQSFSKLRGIFQSNFKRRNIELRLPMHAYERSVEGERGSNVTEKDLMFALQAILKKIDHEDKNIMSLFEKAKNVADKTNGIQITFRFPIENNILNIPSVLTHINEDKFRLTIKTIMVKKHFKTYEDDIVITL